MTAISPQVPASVFRSMHTASIFPAVLIHSRVTWLSLSRVAVSVPGVGGSAGIVSVEVRVNAPTVWNDPPYHVPKPEDVSISNVTEYAEALRA